MPEGIGPTGCPFGFPTREERFAHRNIAWTLTLPASSEDLFDADAFDSDERLPYWADLWPSAKLLARSVLDGVWPERHAIELGCGVALVSLALLARGFRVVATDYEAVALRFASMNAARNSLGTLETRFFDWRDPTDAPVAPLVIAADVLYEKRNAEAIAAILPRIVAPGGRALLADPKRPWRAHFIDRLRERRWSVCERPLGVEPGAGGKDVEIVLLECAAAQNVA